jgi:hypothetical protein
MKKNNNFIISQGLKTFDFFNEPRGHEVYIFFKIVAVETKKLIATTGSCHVIFYQAMKVYPIAT